MVSKKQYLLSVFSYRNAKKNHTDQSILHGFLPCLKGNGSQTFNSNICKTLFLQYVCMYVVGTVCCDECFLFCVITGKHWFS